MYAACFGLYLGRPQASQYKNLTKEDTVSFVYVFEITLQVWKGHMCGPHFAHRRSTPLSAHRPLQLNCEQSGAQIPVFPSGALLFWRMFFAKLRKVTVSFVMSVRLSVHM